MGKVIDVVIEVVSAALDIPVTDIKPDMRLVDNEDISFGTLGGILDKLEEKCWVTFFPQDMGRMETLEDLAELIESKKKELRPI